MAGNDAHSVATKLGEELDDDAVDLVRDYVHLRADGSPRFTGREFERLGGGGDQEEVANRFTSDDLAALALLGVPIDGTAVLALLDDADARWSSLLTRIGTLDDPATDDGRRQLTDPDSPANRLWRAVREVPTMGPTRIGKLLARKRPNLIPVYDRVIKHALRPEAWWESLAAFFAKPANVNRLRDIRTQAGAEGILTPLRTLDVVVWMRYRDTTDPAT